MRSAAAILATVIVLISVRSRAAEPARAADDVPRPSLGRSEPAIAVVDVRAAVPADDASALKARAALVAALARFRVRVVEDHPVLAAARSAAREADLARALDKARALAADGKARFQAQDPAAAEAKLRQASEAFESNPLATSTDRLDADLYLARTFFALAREPLVREVFRRVVRLSPELVLDRAVYPAGLVRVYDEVKQEVLASPLCALDVKSSPLPAIVVLDGNERGPTPAHLVNLPPGVHQLALKGSGLEPVVRPVDATSFRVDAIEVALPLERHPALGDTLDDAGLAKKDAAGATLGAWLGVLASQTGADLLVVAKLTRGPDGATLSARLVRASGEAGPVENAGKDGVDRLAEALLLDAAAKGWIPPLAARRNLEAGGGALDPTAPWGIRIATAPALRIAGSPRSFPDAPAFGFRVAADRRLGGRIVLTGESGMDVLAQSRIVLRDSSGSVIAPKSDGVGAVWTSIPLDVGARAYLGFGTWAPWAGAGAGIRWDMLTWREGLGPDRISSPSGIGVGGHVSAGVDRALSVRTAVFGELRFDAGRPGVSKATIHSNGSPTTTIPVEPGTWSGLRVGVGYLRIF